MHRSLIGKLKLVCIPSGACLVDRRGLLVCGMCASVHAALCPWRVIFRARIRADSSEFYAALSPESYPPGVTLDGQREKGTRVVIEPASPIVAMVISYTACSADLSESALAGHPQLPIRKDFHRKSR